MKRSLALVLAALLAACQDGGYPAIDARAANGVYRGVVSDASSHDSVQTHVLDGLLLGFGLDSDRRYSGNLRSYDGEIDGSFERRSALGEVQRRYQLEGVVDPHQRIEAGLYAPAASAELSLFYSVGDSEGGPANYELSGIYVMDENGTGLTLSIYPDGLIEGYDAAGCAYFGRAALPDRGHSLFEVSLNIDDCALGGGHEYGFGIGTLEINGPYAATLVLPVWLDESDRVETWLLERR